MNAPEEPFAVVLNDGVLELTLNTPACSHNILSRDAADQLCRILSATDPQRVAVIVIRSGKPNSWINGVGLLMAGTARDPEDIPAMTQGVTRAYRALRDFPVPSVAVIEGNCYGCGVEFSLHCDYRIACESYDTHFYMTELADYLFIPAFGASQDLPRLLGLEAATDLLLWGERWSARLAAERGLVDHCFDAQTFDVQVAKFVTALAAQPRKRPIAQRVLYGLKHEAHGGETLSRINMLPPAYQAVYREAYSLMVRAAKAAALSPSDYAAELRACGESVVRPIAKASVAFFFIRQLATHYCLRGYQLPEITHVVIDPAEEGLLELRHELVERHVRGLRVVTDSTKRADVTLELASVSSDGEKLRTGTIGTILQARALVPGQAECLLYSPLFSSSSRLVEIAIENPRSPLARDSFALFDRAGYCPVLSQPKREFATNLLLAHHLAPLIAFVANGGRAAEVHASLREFGFVKPLGSLLRAIPHDLLCHWITPLVPLTNRDGMRAAVHELVHSNYCGGVMRADVLDALLVSLSVFAIDALRDRVIPHPALVDVMARELIDFPLMHGSLCRYLDESEIARLCQVACTSSSMFSADALAHALQNLATGHRFYNATGSSRLRKREEVDA